MSIGMDSGWYRSFLEAYVGSWASADLPIWRVFRQDGDTYPGVALTDESDEDSTWKEINRLRAANPGVRYNCSHSIQIYKNDT
jgi:hypothetical protein